jgi:predicted Zn-dependent protease
MQHGTGVPLVLKRSNGIPPSPATGSVRDGRYHHDETGLEFDVPAGFSDVRTMPYANNRGQQVMVSSKDNGVISAWVAKGKVSPNRISKLLDGQIPAKVARRKGPFSGYEIPADSVQTMTINGEQAIKATAFYSEKGGEKMVELLTWIQSENAVVHFYAMVPAEKLPAMQGAFDQMVLSAKLP